MVALRTITCMMRFCWERRGLAAGEILPSAPCPFVHASDLALGVGSKILDDQTSEADGDMQGAQDCCRSLPNFVRNFAGPSM